MCAIDLRQQCQGPMSQTHGSAEPSSSTVRAELVHTWMFIVRAELVQMWMFIVCAELVHTWMLIVRAEDVPCRPSTVFTSWKLLPYRESASTELVKPVSLFSCM